MSPTRVPMLSAKQNKLFWHSIMNVNPVFAALVLQQKEDAFYPVSTCIIFTANQSLQQASFKKHFKKITLAHSFLKETTLFQHYDK